MFLCVLGLVGFCLVLEGSDEMRKMPMSMELALRLWLCCKDLVGVTPLKQTNLLLGLLISGRDCERPVDIGPIRISLPYSHFLILVSPFFKYVKATMLSICI